ncbi:hypothetical protein HCB69_15990 [Listeria booriae]|uniref:Uncharacterized protein n=1 Tax=Listeria booriae TaxID=1552123 RepID=A0A842G5M1_9LIST|nr:hypothetical protein [Listeria booriae]MBC2285877.1 hypothetical protein [Listeria booriae]
MTSKYYKVAKDTEFYNYAQKIYAKTLHYKQFSKEVSDLLGFEANGNIIYNRKDLYVKRSALEDFTPELLKTFKRGDSEWMTPRVANKALISTYAEIRKKYNMDYETRYLFFDYRINGGSILFDFDNSGFVYVKVRQVFSDLDSCVFIESNEIEFLERELYIKKLDAKEETE